MKDYIQQLLPVNMLVVMLVVILELMNPYGALFLLNFPEHFLAHSLEIFLQHI